MRTRSIIRGDAPSGRVNVTPLIDVVMVLIVFYLMVGQLAIDRRTEINLPRTATGIDETQERDPIVLGIHNDGSILLNGEPINPNRVQGELTGRLARQPGISVRVRADRDAPFRVVRPVLDDLRDAGVDQIELVTEQQP